MSETILYYDCFAGISGDMNLAALVDLGVPEDHLREELRKIGLDGFSLVLSRDAKHGIHGTRAEVLLSSPPDRSAHTDDTSHHSDGHEHQHRTLKDILHIIDGSDLSEDVKRISVAIFRKVAEAEAKVHDHPVEEVHFHEVGALDSIVDIIGAAICIDFLKPDTILSSTVELGGGFVKCEHGVLPVPAPATAEILKEAKVKSGAVPFEATTPTGAAILAACVETFTDEKRFTIKEIGYGVGHKDGAIPNILRVFLAEAMTVDEISNTCMLECNIDDMNPELYGYLVDRLFEAGASDVFFTPIIMKKNRPATKLSVLTDAEAERKLTEVLLKETTSFGVRRYAVEKRMLDRKVTEVETSLGKVRIKTGYLEGQKLKSKPEFEDCRRIAEEKNIALLSVYSTILKEIQI